MKVYYISALPKFEDEETLMFYASSGMIVIRSTNHIARVNETSTIDDLIINQYAISRGFEKVLETKRETKEDSAVTTWEEKFDTDEWKHKVKNITTQAKNELFNKVRHRIIVDNTVKSCLSEMAEIDYK